jgi:ABC transporter transmembrane region
LKKEEEDVEEPYHKWVHNGSESGTTTGTTASAASATNEETVTGTKIGGAAGQMINGDGRILIVICFLGFTLNVWGFRTASERLSKRVSDTSFSTILRREVAYFDLRSVGRITSQLQDNAARIQAFPGEPIRSMLISLSPISFGLILLFIVSLRSFKILSK